jgi:hypothetical protein
MTAPTPDLQRRGLRLEYLTIGWNDSAETLLCAYLSAILLAGLVLNATLGWWWADPISAIGIAGLAVREGREAWEGRGAEGQEARDGH